MADKAKEEAAVDNKATKATTKKTAAKKPAAKKVTKKVEEVAVEAPAQTEEVVVAEVEVPAKPVAELSLKERDPEKFLTDFNWHNYEEGIDPVDDGKLEEFEKLVTENFVDTLNDEVVDGKVVFLTDRDAIIDINAKSEGVVSLNEFRYNPDLKVGDTVEVLIDVREDSTGQLILSHRKARTI
jgi:small subunit ribosomal protein S1